MSPELGHNRSISERNDFFIMSVGGTDNPIVLRDSNGNPVELIDLTIPEVIDLTASDDEDTVMTEVVQNTTPETPDAPYLARFSNRALRMIVRYTQRNLIAIERLLAETDVAHREALTLIIQEMRTNLNFFEADELVRELFVDLPEEESDDEDN